MHQNAPKTSRCSEREQQINGAVRTVNHNFLSIALHFFFVVFCQFYRICIATSLYSMRTQPHGNKCIWRQLSSSFLHHRRWWFAFPKLLCMEWNSRKSISRQCSRINYFLSCGWYYYLRCAISSFHPPFQFLHTNTRIAPKRTKASASLYF